MKLNDYQLAPNPRRVRIFLAEKGITIPTVQVDLRAGEQFTPEFRSTGSIPTEFAPGARLRYCNRRKSSPGRVAL